MAEEYERNRQPSGDWVPRPDPTVRTIETLAHDLAGLRELIETRLDAYDKAIDLLQETASRSPTPGELHLDLQSFKEIVATRFDGVRETMAGRDLRIGQAEQAAKDAVMTAFISTEKAVAAALTAAKDATTSQSESFERANTKAEMGTTKLLDALGLQIVNSATTLDEKISGNKDTLNRMDSRLITLESRGVVVRESQTQGNAVIGIMVAGLSTLIALASLIVVLLKVG
jgi:hypothetical protein